MKAIRVENVTYRYNESKALTDICCGIQEGKVTSVIGPNGSGKSTLLKLIAGILKLQSGSVYLKEKNIKDYSVRSLSKLVAYLPQSYYCPEGMTASELVLMGRTPYINILGNYTKEDLDAADWAMNACGIYGFKDKEISKLSGGEQKKIWISMCLARKSEIMVLDEPTNDLDVRSVFDILNLLLSINQTYKTSVILVLHDVGMAIRYSDDIIVMKNGGIYAYGSGIDIINKKIIEDVYGIDSFHCYDKDIPIFVPLPKV